MARSGVRRPPGVVIAAAVVTWVAATGTALLAVVLALVSLQLSGPFVNPFAQEGARGLRWSLAATTAGVVALSALAGLLALGMVRGSGPARWALVLLCVPTAVLGVVTSAYLFPLGVTAAALAVVLLLLLPEARGWFRDAAADPTGGRSA